MAKKKKTKAAEDVDSFYMTTEVAEETPVEKYTIKFEGKNKKQKDLYKMILDPKKQIIFATGECGTGKSYVALSAALQLLKDPDNNYKKIIIVVPTVEAGNMSVGLLPGTLDEKMRPYTEATKSVITKIMNSKGHGEAIAKSLIEKNKIQYSQINFMRGITYDDAILVCDEAENFSKQELFLILSRIGTSKYIFNGDVKQCDRKDIVGKQTPGLTYCEEKLQDLDEIGFVHFEREDIVRNPLITKIMDRWFEN